MHTSMDAKRTDKASESAIHDFALVTTYLPILGLTVRGKALVCFLYWCLYTVRTPVSGIIMVCASIVYVDALLLTSHLDKACGHLSLVALAVLAQQNTRECSDASVVALLVCDLLWSVCTSAEACNAVSSMRIHVPTIVKVLAACTFACAHVLLACVPASMLEMLVRAVLFYVLCSLVVLCAPFAPTHDRSTLGVLLMCAPVLFVHAYLAVAGVLLLVGTHARLIYSNVCGADAKRQNSHNGAAPLCEIDTKIVPRGPKQSESQDLTALLLAAKRMHGVL